MTDSQSPGQADWHIRHELGLEFEYEIVAEDLDTKEFPTMATLNEEMMSNRLCLKRPNQKSWEDREFQEQIGIARLVVKHSAISEEHFTFQVMTLIVIGLGGGNVLGQVHLLTFPLLRLSG